MISAIQNGLAAARNYLNASLPTSIEGKVAAVAVAVLLYCQPAIGFAAAGAYAISHVYTQQDSYSQVLADAPVFNGYKLGMTGVSLTSLSIRPANLFYRALLGPDAETLPESGELFAFRLPHERIRQQILSEDPGKVVSFTAQGVSAAVYSRAEGTVTSIEDLAEILGDGVYEIGYGELQKTLASQKIFVAPMLPLPFYKALKMALLKDRIVTLPVNGKHPVKVSDLSSYHARVLVKRAATHFADYGFKSAGHARAIFDLTLYQLGSLVVKAEDFRVFLDDKGKLMNRRAGVQDAIRLINACGIRGIHATRETRIDNRAIMRQTFQTALIAAEKDLVIFPAVGMGVWAGDPGLYWRAFLDAVAASAKPIEKIFVNPGHQSTPSGKYLGSRGEEFQTILKEYRSRFAKHPEARANLSKIVNLFDRKTDVVQLARLLKESHPAKIVSLFNASDPDVTLGNHVGEYVNNLDHCTTTEENYTALGTNGLCFETITGVHDDSARVVSVNLGAK